MKAEVTEVSPCRQKIEVTVDVDDVDAAYDEVFAELGGNVQIRGFRKGHAPRRLLEKRFSKEVSEDVRSRLFEKSFTECMKDNDLAPLGDPDIEIDDLVAKPGEPFCYSTEVDVRPTFDLPDYKSLKLTQTCEPVTEEMVDEKIAAMRKRFAEFKLVENAVVEDDAIMADITITVGDEEMLSEKATRVAVSGDSLLGFPCEELIKDLGGCKAGDTKTLKITIPDAFAEEKFCGKEGQAEVVVNEVLRKEFPELDQKFAQRLGMDDMAALREALCTKLEEETDSAARQEVEKNLITALIDASSFELPEAFMVRQKEVAKQRAEMQLAQYGATEEFIKEQAEDIEKTTSEEIERTVRWTIISEAIADAEEIEVTESDFQQHIERLCMHYHTTPQELMKSVRDRNGLAAMASEILDIKTTQHLLEIMDITRVGYDDEDESDDAAGEVEDDNKTEGNEESTSDSENEKE